MTKPEFWRAISSYDFIVVLHPMSTGILVKAEWSEDLLWLMIKLPFLVLCFCSYLRDWQRKEIWAALLLARLCHLVAFLGICVNTVRRNMRTDRTKNRAQNSAPRAQPFGWNDQRDTTLCTSLCLHMLLGCGWRSCPFCVQTKRKSAITQTHSWQRFYSYPCRCCAGHGMPQSYAQVSPH